MQAHLSLSMPSRYLKCTLSCMKEGLSCGETEVQSCLQVLEEFLRRRGV